MEKENKYYLQFKNYILSNIELLNILKIENINDYENNWENNLFYAISQRTIEDWKSLIHFDELCKNLINKNNNYFDPETEKIIIKDLENIPNLNESINKLKDELSNSSLNVSYLSNDGIINIVNFSKFNLITKNAWDSFVNDQRHENDSQILIKKGNKKIIIKLEDNCFIILYLNNKDISPIKIDDYLNEIEIKIKNKNVESNILIKEIIKDDIYNWLKKINYQQNKVQYNYNNFDLDIIPKNRKEIYFNDNLSAIQKDRKKEAKIIKAKEKKFIKNLNSINKIMVVKFKNTSYIIASMFSLSQIPEFSDYFYADNNNFEYFSRILFLFKEYLNNLWTIQRFEPIDFLKNLKKKDSETFDFHEEKEPIVFLEKIFEYLNYELNMKDPEINNDIINLINKHKNIPEFFEYKYNSIFGKKFYGVFQIKCDMCGQIIEYEEFNHINIDIEQYCKNNLDNALVYFYFDDLIEYYFKNENCNKTKCNNCNKEIKIEKKIIRFPDIFIFAIKWENFIPKYGFYFGGEPLEENKLIFDEIIDLTNYSYINENRNKYKIRSIINYGIINDNNR